MIALLKLRVEIPERNCKLFQFNRKKDGFSATHMRLQLRDHGKHLRRYKLDNYNILSHDISFGIYKIYPKGSSSALPYGKFINVRV